MNRSNHIIHSSDNFAESVRIELTWVLPQPQLSKPVQYRSVNSPFIFCSLFTCGERGNRTPEPFTVDCFQDSSLDQPGSLLCVSDKIRTYSVKWQRFYGPPRFSSFAALTLVWTMISTWFIWFTWLRTYQSLRLLNQTNHSSYNLRKQNDSNIHLMVNNQLFCHWTIFPLLARWESNSQPSG